MSEKIDQYGKKEEAYTRSPQDGQPGVGFPAYQVKKKHGSWELFQAEEAITLG